MVMHRFGRNGAILAWNFVGDGHDPPSMVLIDQLDTVYSLLVRRTMMASSMNIDLTLSQSGNAPDLKVTSSYRAETKDLAV